MDLVGCGIGAVAGLLSLAICVLLRLFLEDKSPEQPFAEFMHSHFGWAAKERAKGWRRTPVGLRLVLGHFSILNVRQHRRVGERAEETLVEFHLWRMGCFGRVTRSVERVFRAAEFFKLAEARRRGRQVLPIGQRDGEVLTVGEIHELGNHLAQDLVRDPAAQVPAHAARRELLQQVDAEYAEQRNRLRQLLADDPDGLEESLSDLSIIYRQRVRRILHQEIATDDEQP